MNSIKLMKTLLALMCLCLLGNPILAQDWSQFRGPKFGSHSDSSLPVRWSAENIGWKTKLPGPAFGLPTLLEAGDQVIHSMPPLSVFDDCLERCESLEGHADREANIELREEGQHLVAKEGSVHPGLNHHAGQGPPN